MLTLWDPYRSPGRSGCHAVGHCTASVNPDGGSVSWAGRAIWRHWVKPLSGSGLLIFLSCCLVCLKNQAVCSSWPRTCLISWFIREDGSAGQESNEVKSCNVHLHGRGTCSVFKLVAWQGLDMTSVLGCRARKHHLPNIIRNGEGFLAWTLGESHYSPRHNSPVYKMVYNVILLYSLSLG